MHRWKPILFNLSFALNCLLLFLILFEEKLQVPPWLQVAGRTHPLILHFPIVLLVLAVFWELLPQKQKEAGSVRTDIGDVLLLSAAVSAVLTSLFGLFLSREQGYTPEVLVWHKWGGVLISLLTLAWYALRQQVRPTTREPTLRTARTSCWRHCTVMKSRLCCWKMRWCTRTWSNPSCRKSASVVTTSKKQKGNCGWKPKPRS